MTLREVTTLKTVGEADRERVGKTVNKLHEEYCKGDIREIAFFLVDAKGEFTFMVSGSMTKSHLALGIAYLQRELMDSISGPDREPPETIA